MRDDGPRTPHTRDDPSTPPTGLCPPPESFVPATAQLVVTIKFNGAVMAERTSISVSPLATWEEVARTRLEAVGETRPADVPLTVSLFRTADQHGSDRVAAAVNDQVGPSLALGYPHVLLSFVAPVHGCTQRPAAGANPFAT
mmetsp:Transcript_15929/g.34591  ORF Transcript_15929/g.34591 Transcript_15929/m.34591 type:complete len:142 (-) Transcript_15929:262-687(-)